MLFIHVKIFEIIGLETVLGGEAAMFGLAIAGLALIALSLMIRVDVHKHIAAEAPNHEQNQNVVEETLSPINQLKHAIDHHNPS